MYSYFAVRYRDHIIIDLPFLEVRIDTHELYIMCAFFEPTAVFENLFQAYASIAGCSNSSFAPLTARLAVKEQALRCARTYRSID